MKNMRLRLIILILSIFLAKNLFAASLSISPLRINLTDSKTISNLTIGNSNEDKPANIQVRIFSWNQDANGEQILSPTTKVVVSPPIFNAKPNSSNIVRVIRMGKEPIVGEESYRLLIEELPDEEQALKDTGIGILVGHSLPVFVTAKNALDANPSFNISADNKHLYLTITNNGDKYLRLIGVNFVDLNDKNKFFKTENLSYVLGHKTVTFKYNNQPKFKVQDQIILNIKFDDADYLAFGELTIEEHAMQN